MNTVYVAFKKAAFPLAVLSITFLYLLVNEAA